MTIQLVKNTMYNLQTFYGDSGTVTISNIPTDSPTYTLYMQVDGKDTVVKSKPTNSEESVTLDFSVSDIKNIGIGQWPYGVKLCQGESEDTYIPDLRIAPQALFIVKPMVVEGTPNE